MKFLRISKEKVILGLSLMTAIAFTFLVVSPVFASIVENMNFSQNCKNTYFPEGEELDIVFDVETGAVKIEYQEGEENKETLLNYKKNFSTCTPDAAEVLSKVKFYAEKMETETCADLHDIVSGKKDIPEDDIREFNMSAAQRYLENHCI
jgi:hypothetical protein